KKMLKINFFCKTVTKVYFNNEIPKVFGSFYFEVLNLSVIIINNNFHFILFVIRSKSTSLLTFGIWDLFFLGFKKFTFLLSAPELLALAKSVFLPFYHLLEE